MVGGYSMEKRFKFISAMALIAAMCLSACNKVEITEDPIDEPGIEVTPSQDWKVAISATMGGAGTKALAEDPDTHNLIATFETTDNIYVYNVTKSKVDSSPLHPDRNGASAVLTGTLSESYDEGDILVLCYNPEYIGDYGGDLRFDYTNQNGTLAAVADFAKADKTVSAAEAAAKELSGTVSFTNLQSIFKFTFTDGSSAVPVQKVTISTAQGQLVQTDLSYHSFGGMYKGEIRVTPAGTTTEPVYVALRNDTSADDIFYFEVEDGSGHMYKGEKSAPAGIIVNGKFYASNVRLAQVPKPTVILTDNGAAIEPNDGNYGYLDAGSLTVSGTGEGYYFSWASQSFKSLTLSGASITCHSREPVSSSRSILNPIILEGDNYIITDADHAAVAYKSNFSGTEFSQFIKGNGTLTITASSTVGTKGFKNTYSSPVNVAASSGYTLTVSDGVDNGDGTTTWVYTVRPTSGSAGITGGATQEWVQLWADGPKWAKFNVGSTITSYADVTDYTNPDVVGGYYSFRGRYDSVADANGTADTATNIWGSNWATPSSAQEQSLLDNCDWTWCDGTTVQFESGCTLAGWKVTGRDSGYTGNSIFLPLSGIRDQNNRARETVGTRGCYWSITSGGSGAYFINLTSSEHSVVSANQPHGLSVRAIYVGTE